MKKPLQLLLISLLALATPAAFAELWINPGFYSYHFDRNQGYNNVNKGLGAEATLLKGYSLTAGVFENSERTSSHYVGLYAMPFTFGGVKVGAVIGAFDGYPKIRNGGWFPAIIPTVAIEAHRVGLNIGLIPTLGDRVHGAITFQAKFNILP